MAETAVLPNFFLLSVFFALKGSKLFIIMIILIMRNAPNQMSRHMSNNQELAQTQVG